MHELCAVERSVCARASADALDDLREFCRMVKDFEKEENLFREVSSCLTSIDLSS
jgi:hypothetical protein